MSVWPEESILSINCLRFQIFNDFKACSGRLVGKNISKLLPPYLQLTPSAVWLDNMTIIKQSAMLMCVRLPMPRYRLRGFVVGVRPSNLWLRCRFSDDFAFSRISVSPEYKINLVFAGTPIFFPVVSSLFWYLDRTKGGKAPFIIWNATYAFIITNTLRFLVIPFKRLISWF